MLFVDLQEGHRIKNPDIQLSKSVRQIPATHRYVLCSDLSVQPCNVAELSLPLCVCRIVLSGTPIQNELTEVWALFDFGTNSVQLRSIRSFHGVVDFCGWRSVL